MIHAPYRCGGNRSDHQAAMNRAAAFSARSKVKVITAETMAGTMSSMIAVTVIRRSFQKKGSMLGHVLKRQRGPVVRCGRHNRTATAEG